MSRNRGGTVCDCAVVLHVEEEPRRITEAEAGAYYQEYRLSHYFARAHCPLCLTLFLAWFRKKEGAIFDTSYRHAFDDEPAVEDLPIYLIGEDGRRERKLTLEEQPYGRMGDLWKRGDEEWRRRVEEQQRRWRERSAESPAATALEAMSEAVDGDHEYCEQCGDCVICDNPHECLF